MKRISNPGGLLSWYWEAQIQAVGALVALGFKVTIKDRLPIFKLYRQIEERTTGDKGKAAKQLLELLLDLRKQGLEPPHKNGKYT